MNERADAPIHPLNAIAEQFKSIDSEPEMGFNHGNHDEVAVEKDGGQAVVTSIPLLKISSPAILVDQAMQIVWQNPAALNMLWHFNDKTSETGSSPSVFDLLFESRFQNRVDNWKQWLRFFLEQARNLIPDPMLGRVLENRPDQQRQLLSIMMKELVITSDRALAISSLYQLSKQGEGTVFDVAVTRFGNKSLMVFEPRLESDDKAQHSKIRDVQNRKDMVLQLFQPSKTDICVLSASLNDADTLRTEMLDEELCRLLLRTWQISAETVEEYGGIVCQSSATLLLGYFLNTGDVDQNPLNAIQCALELKRKMCDLGREWKIRKSWLHDIELNMGIHAGHEFMASANSALGNHLLALGETVEVANWLSKIASNGQIWTTKAVIQRVPEEELNQLRFGIFRSDSHRQIFIARCFSRIRDLSAVGGAGPLPDTDMAAQSVTQIFDRQGH